MRDMHQTIGAEALCGVTRNSYTTRLIRLPIRDSSGAFGRVI
jgi:hypothetical protein